MNFVRTKIPDVVIIESTLHGDERSYFVETFRADKLEAIRSTSAKITKANPKKGDFIINSLRLHKQN